MTREEAIKVIRKMLAYTDLSVRANLTADMVDACHLAIKALEQDPKIDWDELKRKIFMEVDGGTDDKWLRYADVCDNISKSIDEFKADLPSVTPQEPRKGHWYIDERPESDREVICSNCEQSVFKYHKLDFDYRPKFCPNCGADMRGEE